MKNYLQYLSILLMLIMSHIYAQNSQDYAYPPQDYPQQGYSQQDYGYPAQDYPPQDYGYPQQGYPQQTPTITNTYEITNVKNITNSIDITNTTIVEITNTQVVYLPELTPISVNVCVAVLKGRLEDVKLFIEKNKTLVSNTRSDGNNLLHLAATTPYIELIDYLIAQKVPINQTNNMGQTPLHIVAQVNNIKAAERLLRAGAIVNIKDSLAQTPTWIANINGYSQLLKLLALAQSQQKTPQTKMASLLKNVNPIQTKVPSNFDLYNNFSKKLITYGPIYNTPWHKALFSPGYAETEKLVGLGVSPYLKDKKGQNAFHIAGLYDNIDALTYLLNIFPFQTDTRDNFGATPLHTAAGKAQPEFVKILLNHGCNIYARNKGGWTPFFESVFLGNQAVVQFFLEQGISPNTRTPNGRTPLHEAARLGYTYIVRDLLNNGALYNVADFQGKTPLYLAAEQGNVNIMALLYEKGADKNMKTSDDSTALHGAVSHNQLEATRYLVDIMGINILEPDNFGRTALDIAYIKGFDEITSYLALRYAENQIKNQKIIEKNQENQEKVLTN